MAYSRSNPSNHGKRALVTALLAACVIAGGLLAPAAHAWNTPTTSASIDKTAPTDGAKGDCKGNCPDTKTVNQKTSVYSLISMFSWFIGALSSFPVFASPLVINPNQYIGEAIRNGNTFILNIANIGFIFALLFIAIATILGIESYNLQKALPRLVIAILLANFGLFFVEAIANAAQFIDLGLIGGNLANELLRMTGVVKEVSSGGASVPAAAGWGFTQTLGTLFFGATGGAAVTAGAAAGTLIGETLGVVTSIGDWISFLFSPTLFFLLAYFFVAILLTFRIIGLWFLAIGAPIGIAAGALPATERYAKLYWKKVLAYAFIGPVMLFFLRMALIIWNSFNNGISILSPVGLAGLVGGDPVTAAFVQTLIAGFVIVILFLGLFVSLKMGVEMANFSISAAGKGLGVLWKLGKAAVLTAATIATGGTAAAAGAAAKLGVSEVAGKSFGKAMGTFGKNLKGQFGGKGVMGKFGGVLATQGKGLEEYGGPPEKKPEVINELANQGDNGQVQRAAAGIDKSDPAYIDDLKNDPDAALERARTVGAGLPADEAARQKAAYALRAAQAGVIDRKNQVHWTFPLSPNHAKFVERQAALQGDASIGIKNYDTMGHDEQVKAVGEAFKNGVPPELQNPRAQSDPAIAQAAFEAKRATWEKYKEGLSPAQREAMAGKEFTNPTTGAIEHDGLLGAAAKQTDNTGKPTARMREYVLRSAEVGGSLEHIERSDAYRQLRAAGQNVKATINNVINNDAKYYVNQTGASAVHMMSNVTDARKAVGIMNNEKLPDAVRAALVGELRNPTSVINRPMRRLLLGNMETANQRNALAMQGILKRIEAQSKKATAAAEAAGEAAGSAVGAKASK